MTPQITTTLRPNHQAPRRPATQDERRVTEDVKSRLRETGYHALSEVACEYYNGVLIMRGKVPSFYMKQIAQTVVQKVTGVRQVDNRLDVQAAQRN